MPNCFILRGLPGSGKSTFTKNIQSAIVCSADHYFMRGFTYKFDKTKLKEAHDECFNHFKEVIDHKTDVIVDNTNISKWEYKRYVDYATASGYLVQVITIESYLTDKELSIRNTHGVSEETIKRMRNRMESNGS